MGDLFSRANKKSSSLTSQWAQPENTKKLFGHGRRFPGLWEKPKDKAKDSNWGSRLVGSGSVLHSDSPNKSQEKADADAVLSGRQAPESAVNEKTDGKGQVPPIVGEALKGPGQALDTQTRSFMEAKFGHDFSQVRLYSGDEAERAAKALKARAFTYGSKIVFGRGYYDPESTTGKKLLAHELAHTVQQEGLDVTPFQAKEAQVSQPGDTGERQADQAAEQVVQGKKVSRVLSDLKNLVRKIQRQTQADSPTHDQTSDKLSQQRIPTKELSLSDAGRLFIRRFEENPPGSGKPALSIYYDRVGKANSGKGNATIGFGHKVLPSDIKKYEKGINVDEANSIFTKDVGEFVQYVKSYVQEPLYQYEFDALVSLNFNAGPGNFKNSDLRKDINAKEYDSAAKLIGNYYDESAVGLAERRIMERNLFEKGTYK